MTRTPCQRWGAWVGLLGTATLLRVVGLDFGLPFISNPYIRPDETLSLTAALHLLTPPHNPAMFAYPAAYPWLVAFANALRLLFTNSQALLHPALLQQAWSFEISSWVITARLISVIASVGNVAALVGLARTISGRRNVAWWAGCSARSRCATGTSPNRPCFAAAFGACNATTPYSMPPHGRRFLKATA